MRRKQQQTVTIGSVFPEVLLLLAVLDGFSVINLSSNSVFNNSICFPLKLCFFIEKSEHILRIPSAKAEGSSLVEPGEG